MDILIIIVGVWVALAMTSYVLLVAMARAARASDRLEAELEGQPAPRLDVREELHRADWRTRAARADAPSAPLDRAYGALALDRLVLHIAAMLGACEACLLVRSRDERERVILVAQRGLPEELVGGGLPAGHELALAALASGRPVADPGPRFGPRGAALAASVWWDGAVRGALSLRLDGAASPLAAGTLELLGELAGLVGSALDHQRRREFTDAATDAEVRLLLEALAGSDPYTGEHANDVIRLAGLVGEELGLDRVSAYELKLAAALHDVGKIRVPASILNAAGVLTSFDWDVLRSHPLWGFEMVAAVPGLEAVAPLVRAHHERFDGGGYPDGLAGDRIPAASRIVAVCDAYCALTSDRPYRPARSANDAIEEIAGHSGTQFDPAAVTALDSALDHRRALALSAVG